MWSRGEGTAGEEGVRTQIVSEVQEPTEDGTTEFGARSAHCVLASALLWTRSATSSGVHPTASTCHCGAG